MGVNLRVLNVTGHAMTQLKRPIEYGLSDKFANYLPNQAEAILAIEEQFKSGRKVVLCSAPTGCHAAGQGILLYSGMVKSVEQIRVGDQLMGPGSNPRNVIQLVGGTGQLFRIIPVKGSPFVVNLDHILTLQRTSEGINLSRRKYNRRAHEVIDVSLRDWFTWSKSRKHIYKLVRTGVEFLSSEEPLIIDPYFLGLLLGDGHLFHGVSITTMSPEIVMEIEKQAELWGTEIRVSTKPGDLASGYYFTSGRQCGSPRRNALTQALRRLSLYGRNSGTKFIPLAYKVASRENRLLLLAGIMDTDGSLNKNSYDFLSKSELLAKDVAFIARSLGLSAYVKSCVKTDQHGHGGTYFRINISGEIDQIPCRLPNKIASERQQKKSVLRTSFRVEEARVGEYYGFVLDGDGRYLLDDFTITHNSGKSLLSVVLAKRMAEQYSFGFSSIISVQTKTLQKQYTDDFPHIISMVGRGNFQCAEQPDLAVDEGLCTLPDYKCEDKFAICDYYIRKAQAAKAQDVVSNISYLLHELAYADGMVCGNRNLMVIDEGHLLENAVMNFVSVLLPEKSLRAIGVDLPSLKEPEDAKKWASQILPIVSEGYNTLSATVSSATRGNGNIDVYDVRQLLRYKAMTRRLQVLQNIEPHKWFLAQTYAGYILKPFLVDEFVSPLVTSHSPRVLMMSATFLSSRVMTKLLGLDAKTTGWHEMDSNFPKERRPYNFIPVVKLSYKTGSVGYQTLTAAIDQILEKHPDEKGVVHTSSFKLMNEVLKYTKYPRRFLTHKPSSSQDESEQTRDEAIATFIRTREPRVLISPSVGLGLDLYDDLCRWQILAKVPYASLGDAQVKYRLDSDPEWYSWNAIAAIVQSCGRSTRHVKDWSTCYILDSAFWQLIKKRKYLFPKWWRDALHIVKSVDEAVVARY